MRQTNKTVLENSNKIFNESISKIDFHINQEKALIERLKKSLEFFEQEKAKAKNYFESSYIYAISLIKKEIAIKEFELEKGIKKLNNLLNKLG